MEILKRKLLLLSCLLLFGTGQVFGQFGAWQYIQPIAASNQTGVTKTDYQLRLTVNTQTLVSQGKMNANGDDIRFGDACGTQSYDYWIEDFMNTDTTVIWVRLDSIAATATVNFSMFYGNTGATAASSFAATFPNALITSGNTTLVPGTNYGWLQINAGDTAFLTTGVVNDFDLRIAKIAGVISGSARGYQAPPTSNNGNGPGGGIWGTSSGAGAGSYGGLGGVGGYDSGDPINAAGPVYGTTSGLDIDMGSTGGSASTVVAGHGGGAIRLVAEWLTVTGTINCNGGLAQQPGGGQGAGGGAGGGIFLHGNYVNVSGPLNAKGNGGSIGTSSANDDGGGGGGGRIKVFGDASLVYTSTTDVSGGPGGVNGSAGTGAPGSVGTTYSDTLSYIGVDFVISPEQNNSFPAPIVSAPSTSCEGSMVTISLSSGYSNYEFSDSASVLQSGIDSTYSFVATSNTTIYLLTTGTCTFEDSVQISVVPNPTAVLTVISGGPYCDGDSVELNVNPGFSSVLWSTTEVGNTIFVSSTGSYSVTVTDSNGCTDSDTVALNFLAAPSPVITQSGNMLSTGTYSSYQWLMNGTAISGANSMDYLASVSGNYTVVVTDSNGCTGETATPFIFVGLEGESLLEGISAYPNPCTAKIQVKAILPSSGLVQITIFDLTGRKCFGSQAEFSNTSFEKELDLSDLPNGAYFLQIQSESGNGIVRIVKQ